MSINNVADSVHEVNAHGATHLVAAKATGRAKSGLGVRGVRLNSAA